MTAPPYHMSSDAIGNMYKAPWLGGLIALVVADPNFSRLTNYLTKRNNSVYEPEFSLFATIPGILLFVIGTVEWGWGSQVGSPRGGIVVFFGWMLGGAMVYNAGMIGYIIDAHREWANESQVIFFVAKVRLLFSLLLCYFRTVCISSHELRCILPYYSAFANRRISSLLEWATSLCLGGKELMGKQSGGLLLVSLVDWHFWESRFIFTGKR